MRTHGGRFGEDQLARVPFGRLRSASSSMALAALSAAVLAAPGARADEPRSATEPRVMLESGEVTNVIDAFDDGDTFDMNISLGFEYSTKSARVLRETSVPGPGLSSGGYTSNLLNVARYDEATSKLIPRVDIGIYNDLALYLKLPIILNNSRELSDLDGSASEESQKTALAGAPGEQLFKLPFKSPDRSGIEYIAVGLDLDIMNQARDRTKPTWLFGLEGRFAVGEPMHACTTSPNALPNGRQQVQCADPGDINRNGSTDDDAPFEANGADAREPGVTRGTIGIEVHTILSKRIKYVEPYGGFNALFEFQQSSSDYGLTDLEASLVNRPPLVGTVLLGLMVIPWENREKFGRVTFDFRLEGQYHSEGRDYSELFDALGSSDASSLRQPQWASYRANPSYNPSFCTDSDPTTPCDLTTSVIDERSQRTFFTGLSDVQPYGSYMATASVTWQASEFVKFQVGAGYRHDQGHGIGGDQPCNPDLKGDIGTAGPCRRGSDAEGYEVTGSPNPNYRTTINNVGRRF
jgi:hypothetical protein